MLKGVYLLRIGMKNEGLEVRTDRPQVDALLNADAGTRHKIDGVTSTGTSTETYLWVDDIKTISVIEIPEEHWIKEKNSPIDKGLVSAHIQRAH